MSGFISDEEMANLESGNSGAGFISDEEMDRLSSAERPSVAESAIRGTAQGGTLGWADELVAGGKAIVDDMGMFFSANPPKGPAPRFDEFGRVSNPEELTGTYGDHLGRERAKYRAAEEANPMAYGAGEIGGGIATSFLPIGTAGNAVKLAKTGAAIGGIGAAGSSEADNALDLIMDTGKGTVMGGVLGYGGGKLAEGASALASRAAPKAGEFLKDFAEQRAFKALGPVKKHADAALAKGNMNAIGRTALDEGVVTPFASKETMLSRINNKTDDVAGQLDDVLTSADKMQGLAPDKMVEVMGSRFNPAEAGAALKETIRAKYPDVPPKVLEQRLSVVDDWLSRTESMSIKQAQSMKRQMNDFINDRSYWTANPNASQEALTGVQGAIRRGIEHNADTFANAAGESGGQVKGLNRKLGNLLEMENIVDDRLSREAVNRTIGPSDYGAAGIGAVLKEGEGKGLIAGTAAVANNLGRRYGNNVLATGADKVSKALLKSPRMQQLEQSNPVAFKSLVNSISQKLEGMSSQGFPKAASESPDQAMNFNDTHNKDALIQKAQGTKYQQVLQNAAQNGDQSFSAAHYVLHSRDPEYRKTIGQGE